MLVTVPSCHVTLGTQMRGICRPDNIFERLTGQGARCPGVSCQWMFGRAMKPLPGAHWRMHLGIQGDVSEGRWAERCANSMRQFSLAQMGRSFQLKSTDLPQWYAQGPPRLVPPAQRHAPELCRADQPQSLACATGVSAGGSAASAPSPGQT